MNIFLGPDFGWEGNLIRHRLEHRCRSKSSPPAMRDGSVRISSSFLASLLPIRSGKWLDVDFRALPVGTHTGGISFHLFRSPTTTITVYMTMHECGSQDTFR